VKTLAAALAVLLACFLAGCGGGSDKGKTTSTSQTREAVEVELQEQSFSGQAGTATLTPEGGKTRVDIVLASYAANAQPAHIHKGTCAKLDPTPAYPLNNLVMGKSVTVVPISLDDLLERRYAINVHRSATQLKVYVACGDISKNAPRVPTITTDEEGEG
jgi:hypothetical protein